MAYRPLFGSKHREDVWLRGKFEAQFAGRGDLPICPHCDEPVQPDEDWHECHVGRARSNNGKVTRPGHAACNMKDAREVVVPNNAKADRARAKLVLGTKGPGLGRYPMRAGRRSSESKRLQSKRKDGRIKPGGVVRRQTLSEKLAATLAKRAIGGDGGDRPSQVDRAASPVALPDFPFGAQP